MLPYYKHFSVSTTHVNCRTLHLNYYFARFSVHSVYYTYVTKTTSEFWVRRRLLSIENIYTQSKMKEYT